MEGGDYDRNRPGDKWLLRGQVWVTASTGSTAQVTGLVMSKILLNILIIFVLI